jgi:hypothetical protein
VKKDCTICKGNGFVDVEKRDHVEQDDCGFCIDGQVDDDEKHQTNCAVCGKPKPTPLRNDSMGGYVCLTCIDRELIRLAEIVKMVEETINDCCGDEPLSKYACEKCHSVIYICPDCHEIRIPCRCGHCDKGKIFIESE